MKEGLDWIVRGIANAVADVREKAVLEPWFGRQTPEPGQLQPPLIDTRDREEPDRWWRSPDNPVPEQEAHNPNHTHQHSR